MQLNNSTRVIQIREAETSKLKNEKQATTSAQNLITMGKTNTTNLRYIQLSSQNEKRISLLRLSSGSANASNYSINENSDNDIREISTL
jgi:hypothetical protein